MWSRFGLFGLCCLVTMTYAELLNSTLSTTTNQENQESFQEKVENKFFNFRSKQDSDGQDDQNSTEVCFEQVGCFKMGKPWKSFLRPVFPPDGPEKVKTTIQFFNRDNVDVPVYIPLFPEINIGEAKFDPEKKTAFITHGFANSGNISWVKEMKDAYLKVVDANVMVVDWGEGAQRSNYLKVAGNTRVVGKQVAMFIQYLIDNHKADPEKIHLIGHSLGAQISSYIAKEIRGIARITALDPAQPAFEGFEKEVRLDKSDAKFIDVIHTSAKPFIPTLGFGMIGPYGHVDFYVNGGHNQPGCLLPDTKNSSVRNIEDLSKMTVEILFDLVSCAHGRATEYFTESLLRENDCTFWGHKADPHNILVSVSNTLTQGLFKDITALSDTCSEDTCIPLGLNSEKSPLRGVFVVTTNNKKPYCKSDVSQSNESLLKYMKDKAQMAGNFFKKFNK